MKASTDVLVVGGGPAGLASALACRQAGLTVTLADIQQPPIDKACGEGIMPLGLAALRRLGVDVGGMDSVPFNGIAFIQQKSNGGMRRAQADFACGAGLGVRRIELHQALVNAAQSAGVDLRWRTLAEQYRPEDNSVLLNGERLHPRWIIGADGHASRVREWMTAGAEKGAGINTSNPGIKTSSHRIGLRRHYIIAPWGRHVEVYWGKHLQAYVTPVSSHEVCVAIVGAKREAPTGTNKFDAALASIPLLAERLRGAAHPTPDRGGSSYVRRLAHVIGNNIALVGDASGAVDTITGDGTTLAFCQAMELGEILGRIKHSGSASLSEFNRVHRELMRVPQIMSALLLLMDRNSMLRSSALMAFANVPGLFHRLLGFHLGPLPAVLRHQPNALRTADQS